jgi:hypothetical protein
VAWPERDDSYWTVRLFDEPYARDSATALRFAVYREQNRGTTGYALYRHRTAQDVLGNDSSWRAACRSCNGSAPAT